MIKAATTVSRFKASTFRQNPAAIWPAWAGWRLVYAVCPLEPDEGEAQAARVTLTPDPLAVDELPAGLASTAEGWLRTDPSMLADAVGLDGFFVARWRKD